MFTIAAGRVDDFQHLDTEHFHGSVTSFFTLSMHDEMGVASMSLLFVASKKKRRFNLTKKLDGRFIKDTGQDKVMMRACITQVSS